MNYCERTRVCHSLITEEAVKEALRADKGSGAQLVSWKIKDFTRKGDNYVALVTSVEAEYTLGGAGGQVSYVIKANPCHDAKSYENVTHAIFLKEADFYTNLLPHMNSVLQAANVGVLDMPLCYYSRMERKKELIILEDLRTRGFKMFDRRKGLDIAHAKLALKGLAKLHAASLLLQERKPESLKAKLLNRPWGNLVEGSTNVLPILERTLDTSIIILSKIGGYESSIVWVKNVKAKLQEIFENDVKSTKYHVLCHGDAWNNNMLFRYSDDASPAEVMLLDLQACRRVSFANDLNFLLYTSLTGDVRKPNLDALLETYRGRFNAVMEAGGAEGEGRLSEAEVLQEFRSKNVIGAIFTMMIICVILLEPQDVEELSDHKDKDIDELFMELRKKALDMIDTNPLMRPRFLAVFDEFIETGLIPA
ncbi:uncharacterized protein LOC119589919 isoform X5 [Penaeus monodon]|uniref:uncharacterized protein LOC119589919 isoform X4 n=1 Tax=Penaeus monodon TaxID=6687 RepID=UPI0018A73300|nr:uncharacterized protein LOC119589919 isoform X4 [Penaeus monodon]XP_037794504.1 uncharacterized protein LOC119589919 isoform X5 [Penaeus monodon]